MPYKAYLDEQKRKMIEAGAVSITQEKNMFYCKTPGCKAHMSTISCAVSNKAYRK